MRRTRSVLSILYSIYLGIALPVYTAGKAIISSMNQTASNAQIERIQPDEFSGRTGLAEAETATPTDQVWRQLLDHLLKAEPPCPAGEVAGSRLELGESLWRDAPFAAVVRDAEP